MLDQVIPESYIIEKFYEHAGYPRYKKITNVYEGGCPLCREGTSWGKKRRLYFIVNESKIFCHNCGWSGSPLKWVSEVENVSQFQVIKEAKNIDHTYKPIEEEISKPKNSESLPGDCINLLDTSQLIFYKDDKKVSAASNYIKQRRLDTAINRPKSLWFCKNDNIHRDRIIIPFYKNKNIVFYQSRKIFDYDKKPKYLSKINSEKSIFNYDNVDTSLDYIFIFEGPIDSFFVKNGIAVGGIQSNSRNTFTETQKTDINSFPFMEKIWVLDNQYIDESAKNKTRILLKDGHICFIWPKELKMLKDFNDICIKGMRDEITSHFIMSNSFKGLEGIVKLNLI